MAALFALHPAHIESVAWVSERKDVLSAFFWLLTMLAYTEYARRPGRRRYILVAVLFALGLMAKPMLVTLPFVLLLMDYWPLGRLEPDPSEKKEGEKPRIARIFHLVREKIPLFALTAAVILLTVLAQRKGQTVASLELFPMGERVANALVSYVKYVGMMFFPVNLGVYYPHPRTTPVWLAAGAGVLLIALTVLLMAPWRKRPYLAVGWAWWLGTLTPVIGIVQVGNQALADRYTYLPSIGLFIAVAWGVPELAAGRVRKRALGVLAGVILLVFLALAWVQTGYWKNSVTILTRTLNVTRDNPMIHHLLGEALMRRNEREEAIRQYSEVLRIAPDYIEAGKVHQNLGAALIHQGKYKEAVTHLSAAVRLSPDNPETRSNLGAALMLAGRSGEAIVQFREVVKINPEFPRARKNLVKACNASAIPLLNQGKTGEAVGRFREALEFDPDNVEIHGNLAVALMRDGKQDEAISHFQEVLRLTPGPGAALAHFNLASTFAGKKKYAEAVAHYQEALKLKPDQPETHFYLGVVLMQEGKRREARVHFQEALRLKPDYAAAREQLEKASGGGE
ncbi:MAG: tetratricopeptide repeat protein [Desulfobacterales bacterium]|nr:tetratricopeptide repeat protein [Desulfobacterales bacterium]